MELKQTKLYIAKISWNTRDVFSNIPKEHHLVVPVKHVKQYFKDNSIFEQTLTQQRKFSQVGQC